RALELNLPRLPAFVRDLAERDRAAVAELSRPHAELVAPVEGGKRLHRLHDRRTARDLDELSARQLIGTQIDQRGRVGAHRNQPRAFESAWRARFIEAL